MSKFLRPDVYNKLLNARVVPLFYNKDKDICIHVMKACYEGGMKIFEFTNRDDNAHEIFRELKKNCDETMPDLVLGIGSIMDSATAALYIQLGADFIVSPILNKEMGRVCNRRKVTWMPGCMTPSEVSEAEEMGAEFIKIFPANIGGPAFIKAIKGPMPWTGIMASGGVTPEPENLKTWFAAGADVVGMGGQLITKEILANNKWGKLTEICTNVNETIQNIFKQ